MLKIIQLTSRICHLGLDSCMFTQVLSSVFSRLALFLGHLLPAVFDTLQYANTQRDGLGDLVTRVMSSRHTGGGAQQWILEHSQGSISTGYRDGSDMKHGLTLPQVCVYLLTRPRPNFPYHPPLYCKLSKT